MSVVRTCKESKDSDVDVDVVKELISSGSLLALLNEANKKGLTPLYILLLLKVTWRL